MPQRIAERFANDLTTSRGLLITISLYYYCVIAIVITVVLLCRLRFVQTTTIHTRAFEKERSYESMMYHRGNSTRFLYTREEMFFFSTQSHTTLHGKLTRRHTSLNQLVFGITTRVCYNSDSRRFSLRTKVSYIRQLIYNSVLG